MFFANDPWRVQYESEYNNQQLLRQVEQERLSAQVPAKKKNNNLIINTITAVLALFSVS